MTPVALEPAVLAPSISVMTTVPDTAPSDADTAGSVIQDLLKVPPGNPLAGLVLESVTLSDGTVGQRWAAPALKHGSLATWNSLAVPGSIMLRNIVPGVSEQFAGDTTLANVTAPLFAAGSLLAADWSRVGSNLSSIGSNIQKASSGLSSLASDAYSWASNDPTSAAALAGASLVFGGLYKKGYLSRSYWQSASTTASKETGDANNVAKAG